VFVDEAAEDRPTLDAFQRQVRDGVISPGRVENACQDLVVGCPVKGTLGAEPFTQVLRVPRGKADGRVWVPGQVKDSSGVRQRPAHSHHAKGMP
jgi:hypothetical protein